MMHVMVEVGGWFFGIVMLLIAALYEALRENMRRQRNDAFNKELAVAKERDDAWDEIARIRAEMDMQLAAMMPTRLIKDNEDLRAEVERLRASLNHFIPQRDEKGRFSKHENGKSENNT